ncbi:MAG: pyridoxine 5'-phosphate synthase, partial [Gemmatimonadetes bacterium]
PERREEITTEGGLAVTDPAACAALVDALSALREAGIRTSLFIDPDPAALEASARLGVDAVELHTGEYANARSAEERRTQLERLGSAARQARAFGLAVHAGHGLTYENVQPVAAIPELEELNIGHSVVSRALFTGMERAVREMGRLIREARAGLEVR